MNSKKLTWLTMLLLSLNVSGKNNNTQDSGAGVYTKEEMLKYAQMLKNPKNWVVLEAVSPDVQEAIVIRDKQKEFEDFRASKQKEFADFQARQQQEYVETMSTLQKQFEGSQTKVKQYMLQKCIEYRQFIQEQQSQVQK